ncbi:hypothetical protein ANN_09141 [Periplaneta americana]|uniref:Uncharacterized protein n=1 Tax=Periplaneta americana TaxID=6978 RepID=A0ABQ8TMX9_PERAM|nr:hypothetical protein ANN_09141 [Periplaneta americana]
MAGLCEGGNEPPGSLKACNTESYPAFARIGLRENPGKNLNQVTCPDRDSNPGHLVSRPDALSVTPQKPVKKPMLTKQRMKLLQGLKNISTGQLSNDVKFSSVTNLKINIGGSDGVDDSAPYHRAKMVKEFLREQEYVTALSWPGNSPDVVVITEDVQNVHLLLEYRPHIDVSLTCEHDPKLQEYCVCPQNMPQFDSEGIPNQAPETNKPVILNGPTSRNREGSDQVSVEAKQLGHLYLSIDQETFDPSTYTTLKVTFASE